MTMIDPSQQGTVCIVDDEPEIRKALQRLLTLHGHATLTFASAREFLDALPLADGGPVCLLLDISMPGTDGMDLQQQLRALGCPFPVIFLTGRGTIALGVRAMKNGAVDFLTKPVDAATLLPAVESALELARDNANGEKFRKQILARYETLTDRERQVMARVVAGAPNKIIASDFGTGEQNIKIHRGRVMHKMGVTSVADLVRAAAVLGIQPLNG